jgi:hypothetical protein
MDMVRTNLSGLDMEQSLRAIMDILHSANSLARLWRDQGKRDGARNR